MIIFHDCNKLRLLKAVSMIYNNLIEEDYVQMLDDKNRVCIILTGSDYLK